ncbi:antitoxin [Gemmatimonadetes bacterium T265]|nr:antitoxin [Gemmatimonadetes bacterium T265]
MITIDDPETERLVRELAARRGQSIDTVVRNAVLAQTPATEPEQAPPEEQARRHAILVEIARRMDALPVLDTRSADEIIGYDENGLPT